MLLPNNSFSGLYSIKYSAPELTVLVTDLPLLFVLFG